MKSNKVIRIHKIELDMQLLLDKSVRNCIQAFYKLPFVPSRENFEIQCIRYIKELKGVNGQIEDAFIIELPILKVILSRSEIGLTVEEYKVLLEEHRKNYTELAKDIIINEYPIIWGDVEMDEEEEKLYMDDGKYSGNDYTTFNKRY